jgi:nucleotide-binding universal stress UspA family protein
MYRKIAVAYNESPEAERALGSAVQLAKALGAELMTITVAANASPYAAFAVAGDPSLPRVLAEDRAEHYEGLETKASVFARLHGVEVSQHSVEGPAVEGIVHFLRKQKADLLVIGLHQRDFYISRLWSTVYELAQEAPCSILGVH